jgi:hypothetical protein
MPLGYERYGSIDQTKIKIFLMEGNIAATMATAIAKVRQQRAEAEGPVKSSSAYYPDKNLLEGEEVAAWLENKSTSDPIELYTRIVDADTREAQGTPHLRVSYQGNLEYHDIRLVNVAPPVKLDNMSNEERLRLANNVSETANLILAVVEAPQPIPS